MRSSQLRPRGATLPAILITPLIDVIMCLLIVFMVIQPGLRRGLDVQVPPPDSSAAKSAVTADRIVLSVRGDNRYAINDIVLDSTQLGPQLRAIYTARPRKVIFVTGDTGVAYARVVNAIDIARGAGIDIVGLVPGRARPRETSAPSHETRVNTQSSETTTHRR